MRFLMMGWGVESVTIMILVQLLHGLTFGAYHASAIAASTSGFRGAPRGAGRRFIPVCRSAPAVCSAP
jgi:PPP family 3-phenylpropionic acid transporter